MTTPESLIDIVFDGPPGPEAGRFVEVENQDGQSINVGEWVHRPDGYWALRINTAADTIATLTARLATSQAHAEALAEALDEASAEACADGCYSIPDYLEADSHTVACQKRRGALVAYRAEPTPTPAATQEDDR